MIKIFRRCLLLTFLSLASQMAHAQMSTTASTGDYASDLGVLNGVIKTNGFTRDICVEQFSEMQAPLDDAYNTWREKYKSFLQEIAMRWNLLLIQDANDTKKSLADTHAYMNGEFAKLRSALKAMYSKEGLEKFRRVCERYPTSLLGELGNIEKRYPEHVQTIRRVKL
jgi:hypothetical protein